MSGYDAPGLLEVKPLFAAADDRKHGFGFHGPGAVSIAPHLGFDAQQITSRTNILEWNISCVTVHVPVARRTVLQRIARGKYLPAVFGEQPHARVDLARLLRRS